MTSLCVCVSARVGQMSLDNKYESHTSQNHQQNRVLKGGKNRPIGTDTKDLLGDSFYITKSSWLN